MPLSRNPKVLTSTLNLANDILDLIYPQYCASCTTKLSRDRKACFCISCWNSIKLVFPPYCKICGIPYPAATANDFVCGKCIKTKSPVKLWRTIGIYEGVLREAIHQFKYSGKLKVGKCLSELVTRTVDLNVELKENLFNGVSAVIPVPLYKIKLREREFNQSEIIARAVAKASYIPLFKNALIRVKSTEPQSELNKKEREKNVSEAFAVNNDYDIKDKTVLLVDDIVTTGATAKSCAKVLLANGVLEVRVLSLSRSI